MKNQKFLKLYTFYAFFVIASMMLLVSIFSGTAFNVTSANSISYPRTLCCADRGDHSATQPCEWHNGQLGSQKPVGQMPPCPTCGFCPGHVPIASYVEWSAPNVSN